MIGPNQNDALYDLYKYKVTPPPESEPHRLWGKFLDLVDDHDNSKALDILRETKKALKPNDAIIINELMDNCLYVDPDERNHSESNAINRAIAILIIICV